MMKEIKDILTNVSYELVGNDACRVSRIIIDSRLAAIGDMFVAQRGTAFDGHQFISQVIKKGVKCILCEVIPDELVKDVTYIKVPDTHEALGIVSSNFYDNPSSKFKLVGVTGTNGKTSIATLLYRTFTNLGYKAGLLSTVQNIVGKKRFDKLSEGENQC